MMLIDLQRRIAEAGRIRIGTKAEGGRPTRLETFRLTSSDRKRIEQAAGLYGGEVAEWDAPAGKQWQVITKATALEVIVPPADLAFSQRYELWAAGGCQRRCDGVTEEIGEQPCVCDPDARECDIHTRLSVLLRDLPGLGVWRLDTSGYYAAVELAGAVEIIRMAAGIGRLLPARLRLEQRVVKRPGPDGKPLTRRFPVPVLDVEITPAELLAGGQGRPLQLVGDAPAFTPVPALPVGPQQSIAEQSAPPPPRPPRKNAAPELPASGRRRSTAPLPAAVAEAEPRPTDERPDRLPEFVAQRSARPRAAKAKPATVEDAEYWPNRVHAAAAEHDIDHQGVRLLGAAIADVRNEELDEWSSRNLTPEQWEKVDAIVRDLPKPLDDDAASKWLWAIGRAKGMIGDAAPEKEWERLDQLAGMVYRQPPDKLTPAAWVALGLRMATGEYDREPAAVPA